jgi:hypothetical protein
VSDEPRLVRFLVGSGSIEEYMQFLARKEAENAVALFRDNDTTTPADDDVEFISPRVPGRGLPREPEKQPERPRHAVDS